jgi:predicted nucleotidyltransferase
MQPDYTKIYETVVGSTAYGLAIEGKSDVDKKGIAIPNIRHIFGLHPFEQHEINVDYVIYSLQKFVKLAADANPTICEMLFVEESDILYLHPLGLKLRDNRDLFLSTKAKHSFGGYAFSQILRIKNHQKWLNNPQVEPNEKDFFKEKTMRVKTEKGEEIINYTKFMEQEYDAALKKYNQYCTWKKERNPERAVLEAQFGYDCKFAMHAIRLLKTGLEVLKEGKLVVKRVEDREQLLGIRNGKVSYEDLVKYAEDLLGELDAAYESSPLPSKVDMNKIEDLMMEIQSEFYGIKI